MTINQALKKKNKLIKELNKQYEIAIGFNSQEVGNPRRYEIIKVLDSIKNITNELVELKTKISIANTSILNKILGIAELKGMIKRLKEIPTREGKRTSSYGGTTVENEVQVNHIQMEKLISSIEEEIESLQDEIDIFNSTTKIN